MRTSRSTDIEVFSPDPSTGMLAGKSNTQYLQSVLNFWSCSKNSEYRASLDPVDSTSITCDHMCHVVSVYTWVITSHNIIICVHHLCIRQSFLPFMIMIAVVVIEIWWHHDIQPKFQSIYGCKMFTSSWRLPSVIRVVCRQIEEERERMSYEKFISSWELLLMIISSDSGQRLLHTTKHYCQKQ